MGKLKHQHKKAKMLRQWRGDVGDILPSTLKSEAAKIFGAENVRQNSSAQQSKIFDSELEELTPELGQELLEKGLVTANLLEQLRAAGMKYNRERNSFMDEPEFF